MIFRARSRRVEDRSARLGSIDLEFYGNIFFLFRSLSVRIIRSIFPILFLSRDNNVVHPFNIPRPECWTHSLHLVRDILEIVEQWTERTSRLVSYAGSFHFAFLSTITRVIVTRQLREPRWNAGSGDAAMKPRKTFQLLFFPSSAHCISLRLNISFPA